MNVSNNFFQRKYNDFGNKVINVLRVGEQVSEVLLITNEEVLEDKG